jgi:hypothetical protein
VRCDLLMSFVLPPSRCFVILDDLALHIEAGLVPCEWQSSESCIMNYFYVFRSYPSLLTSKNRLLLPPCFTGPPNPPLFCYSPVNLPPASMIKLRLASGRVVVYEGTVDELERGLTLTDYLPKEWIIRWVFPALAVAVPDRLGGFLSTLLDVSFSIGVLNLVPMMRLDGGHCSRQFLRVLAPSRHQTLHRYLDLVGSFLLVSNIVFGLISLFEGDQRPP